MIKDFFIPERIGTYYLWPKRVLGFEVNKTHVYATQAYFKGRKIIIERCFEERIEPGTTTTMAERTAAAIKRIVDVADKFDSVITCLPTSVAIFKTLKLPFTSAEKIKMVVDYEIEPLLPFSLEDAVIDFIIISTNPEDSSSQVLVVAVQNQYIAQHLELFALAGINPELITIDTIALYNLFARIPYYAHLTQGAVLFNIGSHDLTLTYIYAGQFKVARSISKGFADIAKDIADKTGKSPGDVMEHLIRFGLTPTGDQAVDKATTTAINNLLETVSFTITSFTSQTVPPATIEKIFLVGQAAEIKELDQFMSKQLHIPTEPFNSMLLAQEKNITIVPKAGVARVNSISLATALSDDSLFNLRQKEFAPDKQAQLKKQLIITFILLLGVLGTLIGHSYWQIRKFKRELAISEKEVISALQETLKDKMPKIEKRLADTVQEAERVVQREQKQWFAFSGPARASFLTYLLELSTKIDKQELGLTVEKITISDDMLTLKGDVKDSDALIKLEEDLRKSKLFNYQGQEQNTKFTMEIPLRRNGEE